MKALQDSSLERLGRVWKPLATALILGVLAMAAVTWWSTGEQTWQQFLSFDHRYALVCFLMVATAWVCNGLRLKLLAGGLGHRLPLWRTTQVTLSGEFGIAATPAGSGMVILRVFLMRQLGVPPGVTLSMLAVDGVMDAIFFAMVVPLGLWPVFRGGSAVPAKLVSLLLTLIAAVALVALLLVAWRKSGIKWDRLSNVSMSRLPRWRRRWRAWRRLMRHRLAHSVGEFRQGLSILMRLRRRTLASVFSVMLVQWCLRYGVLPMLLWGFGRPVNPFPLFLLQGILFTGALAMVVPGGSGGIELAFAVLMSPVIPGEMLGAVLILWRFFTYYLYLIGGGAVFATIPFTFPARKK